MRIVSHPKTLFLSVPDFSDASWTETWEQVRMADSWSGLSIRDAGVGPSRELGAAVLLSKGSVKDHSTNIQFTES